MKYFVRNKNDVVEFNSKKSVISYVLNSYSQDQLEMFVSCKAKSYCDTRVVDIYGNATAKHLKEIL